MDLKVSGHDVFLCLDKSYCTEDEGLVLAPVSKYRPLLDWITRFRPSPDYKLAIITVTNVSWVAQRVSSITADVTLQATKNSTLTIQQAVTLTDLPTVGLLPIFDVEGVKTAVLIQSFRLAAAGVSGEVFLGQETKPGCVTMNNASLLDALGFDVSPHLLQPLGSDMTFGNESLASVKLFKTVKILSPSELTQAQEAVAALASPSQQVLFVALSEVAQRTNDLKTALAGKLAAAQ